MLEAAVAGMLGTAAAVLVLGVAWRVVGYTRARAPLRIPTTPAPTTWGGVVVRTLREIVLFESLFKASRWTWAFGWPFHVALLVVLAGHTFFFVGPVWAPVASLYGWLGPAAVVMLIGLGGLLLRRIVVDRVRYVTTLSDHLLLVLLLVIGMSGLGMRTVAPVDIGAVKGFVLGLYRGELRALPAHPVLLVHLVSVSLLLLVYPFSKLMHAPGLLFSPTRYQVDDARERGMGSGGARGKGARRSGGRA